MRYRFRGYAITFAAATPMLYFAPISHRAASAAPFIIAPARRRRRRFAILAAYRSPRVMISLDYTSCRRDAAAAACCQDDTGGTERLSRYAAMPIILPGHGRSSVMSSHSSFIAATASYRGVV